MLNRGAMSLLSQPSPGEDRVGPRGRTHQHEAAGGTFYTPENSKFYSTFRYSELDPNTDQIRLLIIKPPD